MNGGCRFSKGKRVTNATPIFIRTSATSAKLGTHTLNSLLPFFTEEEKKMSTCLNNSKETLKALGWGRGTDLSDKQQCRRCHRGPVVSERTPSSHYGLTSSGKNKNELQLKLRNLDKNNADMLCVGHTLNRKRVTSTGHGERES